MFFAKERLILLFAGLLSGMLLSPLVPAANAQDVKYDQKLKLNLNSVLPDSLIKGRHYSIDQIVHSDGYMNKYIVRSEFGNAEVRGTYFLIKYLTEIDALAYINSNYGSIQVVQDSVGKTAEGLVTGPVKAAQKLYDTASNTEKLEQTVKSVPGGIANLFRMAADTAGSVADFAYKTGKSAISVSDNPDRKKEVDYDSGLQMIEKGALDLIGYNKSYRELARNLKVDPYTENKLLLSELRRVASLKTTVDLGSKFVPSLYSIPEVGVTNKYLGYADRAATYEDPKEVDKLNRKILDSLGYSSEEKKKGSIEQLFKNHNFSPPMRNEIASSLHKLQQINQADSLLFVASQAKSREAAQFYVQSIRKLADLSANGVVMKDFVSDVILPAAITDKGSLIVPLPVDYLFWTPEVSEIFSYFEKKAKSQGNIKKTELIVAGKVSPKARKELANHRVNNILESVQYQI